MHFTVGSWNVIPEENKLVHNNTQEESYLASKSMAVLIYFAQNPGQVIGIDELITHVWQDRVVSDHAVYRVINQLRNTLDAENKQAYFINIPKKGYQLTQTVTALPADHPTDLEPGPTKETQTRIRLWPMLSAVLLLILIVPMLYQKLNLSTSPSITYPKTQPLTSELGNHNDPSFSADGNFVAISMQPVDAPHQNIHILNTTNHQSTQITFGEKLDTKPVISRQANRLVYISRSTEQCEVMLVEAPLSKQPVSKSLFECDWQNMDLAISDDGKTLFYTQASPPSNQHKIYSMLIDTKKTLQLTTIKTINSQGDRIIALSPDNQKLAFLRDQDWHKSVLGVLNLDDFTESFHFTTGGWLNGLAWTHDSKHIIFQDGPRSLALLTDKGKVFKLTSVFTEDIIAISNNGTNEELAIAFGKRTGGIHVDTIAPSPDLQHSPQTQFRVQSTQVDSFPSFANQSNQLAFMSKRTGNAQIWLTDFSGASKQLTVYQDGRSVRTIRWSPNDRKILTEFEDSISYINVDDLSVHPLILNGQMGSVGGGTWNLQGDGIYFASDMTGDNQIHHLDLKTNTVDQITQAGGIMAFPAPESRYLYLLKSHEPGLWKFDPNTLEEHVLIDEIDSSLHRSVVIRSSGIFYANLEGSVKFYDFNTQQIHPVETHSKLIVPMLSVSYDDQYLAYPIYTKNSSSVYILKD